MEPNPLFYNQNNSLQMSEVLEFLSTCVKMDWSQKNRDIVMDIGCGSGNVTKKMLLPLIPDVKKVIALDVLPDMIRFAKRSNYDEKIQYHVADFENPCYIKRWTQKITKVVSVFCFHWMKNQQKAFENLYTVLTPDGEAALSFLLRCPSFEAYPRLMEDPKWSKYLKNVDPCIPESHFKNYGADHYRLMLKDIGFNVVLANVADKSFTYADDKACADSCYAICSLVKHIPGLKKEEFKKDLFDRVMTFNSRSATGKPVILYRTLTLHLRKLIGKL